MENPSLPENGKKKRWTVEEKVQIVRRYLKDHMGLADLAEETGSTPGLILQWAKQALEGLDQTFSKGRCTSRERFCTGKSRRRTIGFENWNRSSRNSPRRTCC